MIKTRPAMLKCFPVAILALTVGCGMPNPVLSADDVAVVERGEHQVGAASVVENDWRLTPTNALLADAGSVGRVKVLDRRAIVVVFEVENLSERRREFVDHRWDGPFTKGYTWDVWFGAAGDSEGGLFDGPQDSKRRTGRPRFNCAEVDLPDGLPPSWRYVALAEVGLRESERVEYIACWRLPATASPPYTLYLGSEDSTVKTFDLRLDVADEAPDDDEGSDTTS